MCVCMYNMYGDVCVCLLEHVCDCLCECVYVKNDILYICYSGDIFYYVSELPLSSLLPVQLHRLVDTGTTT